MKALAQGRKVWGGRAAAQGAWQREEGERRGGAGLSRTVAWRGAWRSAWRGAARARGEQDDGDAGEGLSFFRGWRQRAFSLHLVVGFRFRGLG